MLIVEPTTARVASHARYDAAPTADPIARIGPNAIIQLAHVLRDRCGEALAGALLYESTGYALTALPQAMVDEREVQAFVRTVVRALGARHSAPLLHEAGHRTATYLMAHRIPRPAQWIMKALPGRIGLTVLLRAMQANAWTFAGSGSFSVRQQPRLATLEFHSCAMCRQLQSVEPMCDFYAGTFEHLIRTLVAPRAQVQEVECQAQGAPTCRFEVTGFA